MQKGAPTFTVFSFGEIRSTEGVCPPFLYNYPKMAREGLQQSEHTMGGAIHDYIKFLYFTSTHSPIIACLATKSHQPALGSPLVWAVGNLG